MLHLHCLVKLCSAYYITQLYKQLQANSKYTARIIELIDCIIRYSIILEDEVQAP